MKRVRRLLRLSPVKIAVGYLVFGGLWILLSDRLVLAVAESRTTAAQLQTAKGWLFVLVSAGFIYALAATRERQIASGQAQLLRRTAQLNLLHRVFRHNIRNDLNVILGRVSLVRESLADEAARADLATAYRTAERIVEMSEKLRVIERTNVERDPDETVDLAALVRRELESFRAAAPAVAVEADLPETAMVYGDDALCYAIRELFENAAAHFDGPLEDCRLSVAVEQSLPAVTVRVADNGPGIPEAELRALHAEAGDQLVHTSGIGLWLVAWLTRLADGVVEFDAPPAGGTEISLTFTRAVSLEELTEQARRSVER